MSSDKRLVLLDRDGVLNEDRPDHVKSPDELIMIAGSADAVARMNAAGLRVAVVTNQSGIGRNLFDESTLALIHAKLCKAISDAGGQIDRILCCPDPPWAATNRRKPGPGMLLEALSTYGCTATDTPMIGDSLRDLEAAAAAGCPRILVRTGKGAETIAQGLPDHVSPVTVEDNLATAVNTMLGNYG
jgi:D-glycero-D-manno-heptose 1,7-bisphosphate phosphatase